MPSRIPIPPIHPRIIKYTSDEKSDELKSSMVTLNTEHNITTATLKLINQT